MKKPVKPAVLPPVSSPVQAVEKATEKVDRRDKPGAEGRRLLREFITAHGLGVVEFARSLGRDAQSIHAYLSGKRRPDEDGQKQFFVECGIPIPAWLTPAEIRGVEWKARNKAALAAGATVAAK